MNLFEKMVPRGGIEPPTLRFSGALPKTAGVTPGVESTNSKNNKQQFFNDLWRRERIEPPIRTPFPSNNLAQKGLAFRFDRSVTERVLGLERLGASGSALPG
jgi:hypothetical protein